MSGKPVRFHPEADQEYLSSLVWYNEATQPRLILKMNSSGQSLPSQKRLSVGRFIFRSAADAFFINSPQYRVPQSQRRFLRPRRRTRASASGILEKTAAAMKPDI